MVVFVDLEDDDDTLPESRHDPVSASHVKRLQNLTVRDDTAGDVSEHEKGVEDLDPEANRPNPNLNGFSAALSCYPAVRSIANHLDLNDLHALSRTCRQFRSNLLECHHQLLSQSLRCVNDSLPIRETNSRLKVLLFTNDDTDEEYIETCYTARDETENQRSELGPHKWGRCARDLVGECRRCGVVVCRNCATKPPSTRLLKGRHRRLCATCKDAPLWMHTLPPANTSGRCNLQKDHEAPVSSGSSTVSSHPPSSSSSTSGSIRNTRTGPGDAEPSLAFTASAFEHDSCTCATRGVYICQPCGLSLHSEDVTYQRVWTWRSRYSSHIGAGLGTGMGEGDQGQKCGRQEDCLDAVEKQVEFDCPEVSTAGQSSTFVPPGAIEPGRQYSTEQLQAGYLRQEIEGIGGVVKKKLKKRVRIGATVWEFDDERGSGSYLGRESSGRERSWCGWCRRVIKGQRDREVHGDGCFMI